jgi:hypothetical protein
VPRMLRSAPPLRRGALLIRGPCRGVVAVGPGSAEQREERCTASGTRNATHPSRRAQGRAPQDEVPTSPVIARSVATKQSIVPFPDLMDCFASLAMTSSVASRLPPPSTDLPDGQFFDQCVQSLREKYFAFPFGGNRNRAKPSCPTQGRYANVTDAGRMRWTRRRPRRAMPMRTAKSCGRDAPTLVSSRRKRR